MILRLGSTGPDVAALQVALGDAAIAPGPSDGIFGPVTEAAVKRYQVREGLQVDGLAGPLTLGVLGLGDAAPPSTEPAPTLPTGSAPLAPCPPDHLLGVDVSAEGQGSAVDPAALIRCGVRFLYAKAADGLRGVDLQYPRTARASLAAGLPFGPYDVIEPYGPGLVQGQVDRFLRAIEGTGYELRPALDLELRGALVAGAVLRSAVAWCQAIERELGCRPILYTGPAFWAQLVKGAGVAAAEDLAYLGTLDLWLAEYPGHPAPFPVAPAPWARVLLWQEAGGKGVSRDARQLPGTRVDVDVDYLAGGIEAIRIGG